MRKLFCYSFVLCSGMWAQAPVSPIINPFPTRQFGHPVSENLANTPTQSSPNLVEGREVNGPGQIAIDTSGPTPVLYIADIGNNRVLAYKNPAGVQAGKPADVVIGQQDMVSTIQGGPGSALETGLNSPTGVVVDSQGRLYVADAGNNRIMRFPQPLTQPNTPDLVIGQQGFGTGNSANENAPCSSKSLAFTSGSSTYFVSLAIDPAGNLWTVDPVNNRVLMYPPSNLSANAVAPVATVVLGQNSFTTCTAGQAQSPIPQLTKTIITIPSGLVFDSAGNLYVADGYSRVLYYPAPVGTGQAASRVLGIFPPPAQGGTEVYPTQYTLGGQSPSNPANLIPPTGVFTNGTNLFVADTGANRIVEYDIPSKWAAESTADPSPAALNVYGQVGFSAGQANMGGAQPNSSTMYSPNGGAFLGNQMWVSDSGNNRVIGFSLNSANTYSSATALIGQLDYIYNAPNLIVGSEVFLGGASGSASGVVVDNSSSPPHLYVSDPGNNRILCFKDALTVASGTTLPVADMVIGQPDLKTSEINYPIGLAGQPTNTGLYAPIGVAVDNNGNLYVADSGNGRVVRFPAPFNQTPGTQPTANLVLGQSSFTSFIQNASQSQMHTPWGLALFADVAGATPLAGSIAVSDPVYNRVLIFKKGAGGDFQNGQNASIVIGQPSFSSIASGNTKAELNYPIGLASDTSDRLYIADSNNGRVMEFTQAPEGSVNGPTAANSQTGLNKPYAVAINSTTTELWVADSASGYVFRYPQFTTCQLVGCAATAQLPSYFPLGLAVDASGNLVVGDLSNRITFYYAALFFRNAANFNTQALAPGMLAILGREGLAMTIADGQAQTAPWPMTIGGVNVSVNGIQAPIYATNSGYGAIYFQVPYETPTAGTSTVIVTNSTTNAVIGVGNFQMAQANPGFFTANAAGTGPVAATNSDGTVNGPSNPAARGSTVTFYLTGLGPTPSNPPDGAPPSAANVVNTPIQPILVFQGAEVTPSYSGVGGGFAGGWQINVTVPMTAVPNTANGVALSYYDINSNIGGGPNNANLTPGPDVFPIQTTVYVK